MTTINFYKYDSPQQMYADNGLRLIETCGACPEQYDVYRGDEYIAYLRLRHGYFRVTNNGLTIYEAYPSGEGCFSPDERMYYMFNALNEILK